MGPLKLETILDFCVAVAALKWARARSRELGRRQDAFVFGLAACRLISRLIEGGRDNDLLFDWHETDDGDMPLLLITFGGCRSFHVPWRFLTAPARARVISAIGPP